MSGFNIKFLLGGSLLGRGEQLHLKSLVLFMYGVSEIYKVLYYMVSF